MGRVHRYSVVVRWTGNLGSGTSNYRSYGRQYEISGEGSKPVILGSSERIFRGDSARWNPEELLVASISACHKLWYLHLCAVSGINVTDYHDNAEGLMEENEDGSGHFQRVILRPQVTLAPGASVTLARKLHEDAHAKCFIASSVNFPVEHQPTSRSQTKRLSQRFTPASTYGGGRLLWSKGSSRLVRPSLLS